MKLPVRSLVARILVFLGLLLASVNFLILVFFDSLRLQVGEGALLAFGVAGVVVVLSGLCFDRLPRGGPSQP